MTRFYKGDKPAIIWDGERGRQLCRFQGPALEVTDERTATILASLGYEQEARIEPAEPKRKPARSRKK